MADHLMAIHRVHLEVVVVEVTVISPAHMALKVINQEAMDRETTDQ